MHLYYTVQLKVHTHLTRVQDLLCSLQTYLSYRRSYPPHLQRS